MSDHTRTGSRIFPSRTGTALSRAQSGTAPAAGAQPGATTPATSSKPPATETIARRTGAMINEVDFPGFVSQLVNGTFDAIVDASIRQMESYSSLVSAVAKTVDEFTEQNVTFNQARDWLATRYPGDVRLVLPERPGEEPKLAPRSEELSPAWLSDYGLEGEELSEELLEERILPLVRNNVGAERQQLLATMVMLGLNRVAIRDGSISAKVMFRAAARDAAAVQYATSSDPQSSAVWGERGSLAQAPKATTMVSTLAVNAQNESSVRADLFGEVKLNFVSETLPLDQLADAAKQALIQRHTPAMRAAQPAPPTTGTAAGAPAQPPAGSGETG